MYLHFHINQQTRLINEDFKVILMQYYLYYYILSHIPFEYDSKMNIYKIMHRARI